MSKLKEFFKPTWKKFYWLVLCYLVAESYYHIITNFVSINLVTSIVSLILKPTLTIISQTSSIESIIVTPIANTLDLIWLYLLATLFAKEISKEKS